MIGHFDKIYWSSGVGAFDFHLQHTMLIYLLDKMRWAERFTPLLVINASLKHFH